MQHVPDIELRSEIRSLLVRHRVDLQRLQVRVTSGTVRMCGEVSYHGGQAQPASLDALETEVTSMRGVKHLYLDLYNWRRIETGEWRPVAVQGAAA